MSHTSSRALAMPAIVAIATFTATGPSADVGDHDGHDGHGHRHHGGEGLVVRYAGPLVDLQPTTAGPLDGASAAVRITTTHSGSRAVLRVRGVEGAEGVAFGAHLHSGPCVAGGPAAALGHYNTDVLAGVVPPEVSERTEVWLDFTVDDEDGSASASVPFVPVRGARSVVIHAEPTNPATGTAGPRLACLPVVW